MVVIMEMSTGKIIEEPVVEYDDEVLNASWLPHPAVQAGLQTVAEAETIRSHKAYVPEDPDRFLRDLYRLQE